MRRDIAASGRKIGVGRPVWAAAWLGAALAGLASSAPADAIRKGPAGPDPTGAPPDAALAPGLAEAVEPPPSPWESLAPSSAGPAPTAIAHPAPAEESEEEEGDDNLARRPPGTASGVEAHPAAPHQAAPAPARPVAPDQATPAPGPDLAGAPGPARSRGIDAPPAADPIAGSPTRDAPAATDPVTGPPARDDSPAFLDQPRADADPAAPWKNPPWIVGQGPGTPADLGLPLADPLDPPPGLPAGWDTESNIGKLIDASIATEMRRTLLHATAPAVAVARATSLADDGDEEEDNLTFMPLAGDPAPGLPVPTPEPGPLALVALIFLYGWRKARVSTRGH